MSTFAGGWVIRSEGDYLFIARCGKPGEIIIKAETEGFVVDVWPAGEGVEPEDTMCIFYTDLEEEEED